MSFAERITPTKEKLRQANLGRKRDNPPWNKGKKHSIETKNKISAKAKMRVSKAHTEETKNKMKEAWKKRRLKNIIKCDV